MQTLIQEVGDLLRDILDVTIIEQFTFQQIFIQLLAFDPLSVDMKTLQRICDQYGYSEYINQLGAQGFTGLPLKDAMLQVLFSEHIEPRIAQHNPVCITHFPASQASLAKLAPCKTTALRFEFYFRGIELANGFEELSDAQVQYQRFIDDNQIRQQLGKSTRPIDHRLIDALHAGLPECSGVALGVDRLIMLAVEANSLSEVISFDIQRA
jgi:lysyl-tRNA synthetase class 2